MIMKFVPFLFNDGKGEALNGNCVFFAKEREKDTGLEDRRCIEVSTDRH